MLFAIGCYIIAMICLVATGFPEARKESLISAGVFAGIGLLIQFVPVVVPVVVRAVKRRLSR